MMAHIYKDGNTALVVVPCEGYGSYFVVDQASGERISAFAYLKAARIFAVNARACPGCRLILIGAYDTDGPLAGLTRYAECYGCSALRRKG